MPRKPKPADGRVTFSAVDADLGSIYWSIRRTGGSYATARIRGEKRYAHRVVMERVVGRPLLRLEWVDHINGDPLDCRRENLRLTDPTGNAQNQAKRKWKSGARGVRRCEWTGRWAASVRFRGTVWLKRFSTFEEAAQAAAAKRKELGFLGTGDA